MMRALEILHFLGAVDDECELTENGLHMAEFPVDPHLSRTLIAAGDRGCIQETLNIIAMLSVPPPFQRPRWAQKAADKAHQAAVKASNTQSTVVEEATSQVNTYNAVLSAFDFCKTFGTPVEEVAEVVEEAKDEVTAVDSNDEVKVRFETTVEEATVEAVTEEPIPEAMTDEPNAEAMTEEPNAEAMTDEPCAEAMTDEPNVEAVTEEPHVEATTVEATEPVHQEEIEIQGDGLGLESRQMSPTPVKMMSPTPGKSPQVDFHVKENTPMQDGNAMSFDVY